MIKIKHPVAIGLALGNSAHAIGTSKALEFGEIEGAMSSLSIVIAGLLTHCTINGKFIIKITLYSNK
ncbi:MAG: LrgB family protein [Thomasclavelia ramosa]